MVAATATGGMICNRSITAFFYPPELRITENEVRVRIWSMFGMRCSEQKIPLARVSAVQLNSGVFWSSIIIEAFGGGVADFEVAGIQKTEARDMVAILDQYVMKPQRKPTGFVPQENIGQ